MMEGKISTEWAVVQAEHLHSIQSNRIAENWIGKLILCLQDITHSLWEARNDIAHIKDPNGLCLEEGLNLKTKVMQEYALGSEHCCNVIKDSFTSLSKISSSVPPNLNAIGSLPSKLPEKQPLMKGGKWDQ